MTQEHRHQILHYDYKVAVDLARLTRGDADEHLMGYCYGTSLRVRNDASPQITLEIVDSAGNKSGSVNLNYSKE